jgi:unconventional prefoldin RPB5 interactor 1
MAASTQSTLEGIERRRAQLQDSVEKLQRALTHWTTWEAEYQMFKEEIESAEDPSSSQMRTIAHDLDASLLNEKEVDELLGKERNANQVVDIVSRRIDYVQQNSATVEKQLDAAEKQLAGVDVLLDPGVDNEEGLPMMDIEEELDEEGNAVSSSVNQTGKGAAEVVEALRKAGVQKADLEKMMQGVGQKPTPTSDTPSTAAAQPSGAKPSTQPATVTESNPGEPATSKKSVSFASEVEVEPLKAHSALEKDGYNEDFEALNFTRGTKVIELDQDDNMVASYPIIPQGESPEDAELRRQMLQYGLSEVGAVVAELDLDDPTADYSDFDDDYDDDEDEEEDEYGRSTRPAVTEDYRQQMLELEKKLNARMLENVGPQTEDDDTVEKAESVRLLKIQKDDKFDESMSTVKPSASTSSSGRKGVRFADDLDISEAPQPVQAPEATSSLSKPAPTISDVVVERPAQPFQAPTAPSKPAKVSRFKSARAGNQPPQPLPNPQPYEAPPVPSGPAGRTLANTVVEHVPSSSEPAAPDEFDPAVLNREIQAEYHKARNKFIQQQGGFKPTEEDEASPIVEERNGQTKKVSRFMAAKLRAEGM